MKLFFNYMSVQLKIRMQYKVSFILSLISQLLHLIIELVVLDTLFDKFELFTEYNKYELYINFSIIYLCYSLAQFLGRGFDKMSNLISNGSFDLLLVRPRNILLQIAGTDINFDKISRLVASIIMIVYSINMIDCKFNFIRIFTLFSIIIGGFILFLSLFIIGASMCFKTIQGIELVNIFTDGIRDLSRYPITIYNKIVKIIFTFIIPLTLINYYPLEYVYGRTNNMLYLILPYIAWLFIIPALLIFKTGLKAYKSSGS